MKNNGKFVKYVFRSLSVVFSFVMLTFSACVDTKTPIAKSALSEVTVTIFNGEHYKVIGDNKKTISRGESVVYEIEVDEGYEIISSFGKECEISPFKENRSFNQKITISDVNYNTTITLETQELKVTDFNVTSNVEECEIEVQSVAGQPSEGKLYVEDEITIYAKPATGYRFHCWSVDNYLASGGRYLSNDKILSEFDFNSTSKLYANFKSTLDTARTIVYDFGSGVEIEQDCSPILAHYYRANTLTEPDLIAKGYKLPQNKMLTGWLTESGEYVGLGSRTQVSEESFITLYPAWKEYTNESDFSVEGGIVKNFTGMLDDNKEVIIPKVVNGQEIVGIASNAFEECDAETYYIPNTVTSISPNAFLNCTSLKTFYMSDNIITISDESFTGCANFTTLHLNAYLKPRYMTNYIGGKSKVYERIANSNGLNHKLILLGGSSVRYGYNTDLINQIFKNKFEVYNLGLNASAGGFAQLELIRPYIKENDILLHAPELRETAWSATQVWSCLKNQYACSITSPSNQVITLCESNWNMLTNITINSFANFFYSFCDFNAIRRSLPDENYYDYHKTTELINGINSWTECYYEEKGRKEPYNFEALWFDHVMTKRAVKLATKCMYLPLLSSKVKIYITFSTMNRQQLYKSYGNEENLKSNSDNYTLLIKDLVEELGITVLLSQYDTIYDGEHFADSDYHLGYPTRDIHTTKVITALKEALGL